MRPHPETGRHYYFRPSKKGTDIPLLLTNETIRRHLEGEITVGLYAINPSTQRCKWVAIDAHYKNSMEDLLTLQYHLTQDIVEPAFEMSKRGGHLWLFLATPLLARECDNAHRCREELATVGWSRLTDWHGEVVWGYSSTPLPPNRSDMIFVVVSQA